MARWNITLYGADTRAALDSTYNEALKTDVVALSGVKTVTESIIWIGETFERGEGYEAVGGVLVNNNSIRRVFGRVESDIYSLYNFDASAQRQNYIDLLQKRFIYLWTDDYQYTLQRNPSNDYCIPVQISEFSIIEAPNQKQFSMKLSSVYPI